MKQSSLENRERVIEAPSEVIEECPTAGADGSAKLSDSSRKKGFLWVSFFHKAILYLQEIPKQEI